MNSAAWIMGLLNILFDEKFFITLNAPKPLFEKENQAFSHQITEPIRLARLFDVTSVDQSERVPF